MSASPEKYDVFINFRGEDTRQTFTSLLHKALMKEDIKTYIDYNLKKGDEVWPALAEAIENSLISLVVFSKDYATSKWCLDELLKILECRKHNGQVVVPVFYEINPSHVRKQERSYRKAFAKYERELENDEAYKDKVSEWKAALTVAANISGWDSTSRSYRDDSQLIESIVEDIFQKLSLMHDKSNELKGLVEIDENSRYIESLLKKLPRIGIWGMGGIGKTTIARHVFSKHFAQYDSVCFLENVNEESKTYGKISLRSKLLRELLKRDPSEHGSSFITRRLSGKKVFIVLDDVDDGMLLEYLCRDLGDLGPNSRLIITTRDRHTISGRVDEIYEVTKWKVQESLRLFTLKAFDQVHPKAGYEGLSERAVAYAGGIPLALEVLGKHLYSKSTEFWESELNYYENKEESLDGIQKVLILSYRGLTKREQDMFLDIAFFFKGENKDSVTRILDAFGFEATSGVEILRDKALISISNSNRIQMHDLLQKMAWDIVRGESKDPGRRSRLRDAKEVCDVLEHSKGTDAIEGIIFDLSQEVKLCVRANTFNIMTKLRFYVPSGKKRSSTVDHPQVIKPFFDKLRYLEWNGYPLKSLPQPFCAEQLVEIRLPHSKVEQLWYGKQQLVNLEAIDLSECKELVKLPDLSVALKLKWMYLSGCEKLCEVQLSAVSKDTLVTLLLDRCKELHRLTSEEHLTSLKKFNVKGCSSLKEFSLSSDSIEMLDLSDTGIEILHPSIGGMKNLVFLNLECSRLTNLPNELSRLRLLTQLRVSNCSVVTKSKLEALFDGLESLKILYLKHCCNLFELPVNISSLSSLYELRLDGSSVKMLPTTIKDLLMLEIQSLDNCSKLRCLPELPPHIKEFHAENCTSLVTVSTLKTFSISMMGKNKYISFKNGLMMELDESLTEDAILIMKSAAFHNIIVRKYRFQTHSFNYNSAKVCLPGRRVPSQFKHRTTDSSITVALSNSLGFIFSIVVSPPNGTQQHGNRFVIQCQCYSEDGRKVGHASMWHHKAITNLNMDHVFVWYDPYHSDSILSSNERKISFEFCVTTYTGGGELDVLFSIKECGICPIYYSEIPRVLGSMNLDDDLKSELCDAIQFESRSYDQSSEQSQGNDTESIEIGDRMESTAGIQSQELDLNEKCHSSYDYDCLIVSRVTQVYDNPQEKENWDEDDNSKEMEKSMILHKSPTKFREEIETCSHKQEQFEIEIPTGGSEDVESSFKTRSDDDSHPSVSMKEADSLIKKSKNDEETKNPQQSPSFVQKLDALENCPLDYSEYKRILEEDPLAIMEKLLSGEISGSSQTCHAETTEIQSESIEMVLDDLRQLAFSRNLLKHLPNNVALGEEVKALLVKLSYRADELSEEQNLGLAEFTKIFREATISIDEEQISINTLQQLRVDRKDSISKLQASKDRIGKFDESITADKNKIKDMDIQIEDIKAQIRQLEEQAHKIQQEKSLLEDACSKCEEERAKFVKQVKNVSSKTIQTLQKIAHVEKKKQEFCSNYERLQGLYAIMRLAPPF